MAPSKSVALASSKTLAEMLVLGDAVQHPVFLIFENGAGIAWRDGTLVRGGQHQINGYQVVKFCTGYRQVCEVLELHRGMGYPFLGFRDMDAAEVSARTGLDHSGAELAKERLSTEPIVWHGDDALFARFKNSLAEYGLTVQSGGRFHHVSSGAAKSAALSYLVGQLRYELGIRPTILACGDAPNDLELIDNADHALIFPQRSGGYISNNARQVLHASKAGPRDWLHGVQDILTNHRECA